MGIHEDMVIVSVEDIANGDLITKINRAIKDIVEDVVSRPTLNKAREVKVKITITPEYDHDTETNFPKIGFSVGHTVPAVSGLSTQGIIKGDLMMINRQDRINPEQPQLFGKDGKPTLTVVKKEEVTG